MKLNPASKKASNNLKEVGSSAVQAKTLPPNIRGATSRLEFPRLRFFIEAFYRILLKREPASGPEDLDEVVVVIRNHYVGTGKGHRIRTEDVRSSRASPNRHKVAGGVVFFYQTVAVVGRP